MKTSGFTLTEVLISIAIIGVVGIGASTMMVNLARGQKQLNNAIEADSFITDLSKFMRNKEGCSSILVNQLYPNPSNLAGTPISIPTGPGRYNGYGSQPPTPISGGTTIHQGLTINSITIVGNSLYNQKLDMKTTSAGPDLFLRSLDLNVNYTQLIGADRSTKNRKIPAIVVVNSATNRISTCHDIDYEAQSLCSSHNGSVTGNICKLSTECKVYGSFVKKQCSDGKKDCKNLTANPNLLAGNCPSNSYPIETGKSQAVFSHNASCGKKCSYAVTTQEFYITCVKCQ